jgi:hypothetical protein
MPTCVIDVAFSLPCRSEIQIVRSLHPHSRRGVSNERSKVFAIAGQGHAKLVSRSGMMCVLVCCAHRQRVADDAESHFVLWK